MFNLDPKEEKALILFFAFLLLGLVYFSTHELPWESDNSDYRYDGYEEVERSPYHEDSYDEKYY